MGLKTVLGVIVFFAIIISIFLIFYNGGEKVEEDSGNGDLGKLPLRSSDIPLAGEDKEIVGDNETQIKQRIINLRFESQSESKILVKKREYLNLEESVVDAFAKKVFEDSLPIYLESGLIGLEYGDGINYRQSISLSDQMIYKEFFDEDYLDGKNYTGFYISPNVELMDYTLSFVQETGWGDIVGTFIPLLGREYYVRESNKNLESLELWEEAYKLEIYDEEIVDLIHPTMGLIRAKLEFFEEEGVILFFDGVELGLLNEQDHLEVEGIKIFVEEVAYSEATPGYVRLVLSPRSILLTQRERIEFENGSALGGLRYRSEVGGDNLEKIVLTWVLDEQTVIAPANSEKIPYFETVEFSMIKGTYNEDDEYYTNASITTTKISTVSY